MGKRMFSTAIEEICEERGIDCKPFSGSWVYLLSRGSASTRIIGYCLGLNGHAQSVICEDKAAASDLLEDAKVPHVRHIFLSPDDHPTDEEDDPLFRLLREHGTLVVKPNVGKEGHEVQRASTSVQLVMALQGVFASSGNACVCPYVSIDEEYRAIVLDGEVRLVYRKVRPVVMGDGESTVAELCRRARLDGGGVPLMPDGVEPDDVLDAGVQLFSEWRHNLVRGAVASMELGDGLREGICSLALDATRALDVRFASVDVILSGGSLQVLEVNGTVIMERILRQDAELYAIGKAIYADAIELLLADG